MRNKRARCRTDHVKHNADVLVVQTAVASAKMKNKDMVLVGDDTDLLVVLLHYADKNASTLFLATGPKQAQVVYTTCACLDWERV